MGRTPVRPTRGLYMYSSAWGRRLLEGDGPAVGGNIDAPARSAAHGGPCPGGGPVIMVHTRLLVLSSQYTIQDPARMWQLMRAHRTALTRLGAHHVAGYQSVSSPNDVLVTIGVRTRRSVQGLLASPAVMEWFDIAGILDLPPVFVGALVDSVQFASCLAMPPPVVVATTAPVRDVTALMPTIRSTAESFADAGIRRTWIYGAVDEPNEVMIVHEMADEAHARRLGQLPALPAGWATRAGMAICPPMFIGSVVDAFDVASGRDVAT